MDDQPQQNFEQPKKKRSFPWWWLITFMLVAALGVCGYMLNKSYQREAALNQEKAKLQKSLQDVTNELANQNQGTNSGSDNCSEVGDSFKSNIKAALNSKRTDLFASYVAETTHFTLAASEKDDDESPDQIVASLAITQDARSPWNFAIDDGILDNYRAGPYGSHFKDASYVGKSVSGMIISFNFNCQGVIESIFVAPDESLL